jgi:hypothetical protein
MGCDLYIQKLEREKQHLGFEVSKKAVEAEYFRDCYNSEGLFAVLSSNLGITLSWWKLSEDKPHWFTKKGRLNQTGIKELLEIIKVAKRMLNDRVKIYSGDNTSLSSNFLSKLIKKSGLKSVPSNELKELDKQEYLQWCDLLITFLEKAIELKSNVIWSV